jgi:hypothetical protein
MKHPSESVPENADRDGNRYRGQVTRFQSPCRLADTDFDEPFVDASDAVNMLWFVPIRND